MTSKIELAEMTSYDIQEAIDNGFKTVVFAVGSNEQHGLRDKLLCFMVYLYRLKH